MHNLVVIIPDTLKMKTKLDTLLLLVIWKKLMCVNCTRTCRASAATVQFVKSCPANETEYNDRAKEKGCLFIGQDCTTPEEFRYHCVLNGYGNASLEVCAPVWFLNGFCAEYNEDGKVIQDHYLKDCTLFQDPCPTRLLSTDSYKYHECYQDQNTKHTKQRKENTFPVIRTVILGTVSFLLLAVIFLLIARQKIGNACDKETKRQSNENKLPNIEEIEQLQADVEDVQDDNTQPKVAEYLEPNE